MQDHIARSESRLPYLQDQIAKLEANAPRLVDIAGCLARFDELWDSMVIKDRCRLVELLVERVDFDGAAGNVEIHFHSTGIANLGTSASFPETNS